MAARSPQARAGAPTPASARAKKRPLAALSLAERLNFLLTNRIPRRWATLFIGWFSRIENPVIARVSIALWRACVDDLRLDEAEQPHFPSLHACFTRRLKPDARPVDEDPDVYVSPCDGVVGAFGRIDEASMLLQAKGFPYRLDELVGSEAIASRYRGGLYVTLRLKSSMYHRFHAPCAAALRKVVYISGDTWNVNPVTLKVIERLYCRNERAVLELELGDPGRALALVPVAAVLVAGIRLHCLPEVLDLRYRGPNHLPCDVRFAKGQEMGYFQHGSTIVLLARGGLGFCDTVATGNVIRAGRPLLRKTAI